MSFVVEDGTSKVDATSYASVDFADLYFEDRGNATWAAATDDAKEQALIRAADYMDSRFRFRGSKADEEQALEFPRAGYDEVPVKVQRAACEYALRALSAPLQPDPVLVDDSGRSVTRKTEIVGPIESTIEYSFGGEVQTIRPWPAADKLLRDYIIPGGVER